MASVAVSEQDNFLARLKAVQERLWKENLLNCIPVEEEINTPEPLITCGCCYEDVQFCTMVQCVEGHLFCPQCLKRYVQETIFGQGKGALKCMTEDCQAIFTREQLMRALPDSLYENYENHKLEESINIAGLEDFVRCKFCNFGAELDATVTYFACTQCGKIFCRHCEELFEDHEGLTCDQIEKNGETEIRKTYEEKMAEAKIRTCSKCKARFTKEDGCNLITCRCGTTMCYICRLPNMRYEHFCRHERVAKKSCPLNCGKTCFLWSNPEEDEDRAIIELQESAQGARARQGYVQERQIGPLIETTPSTRQLPSHDLLRAGYGVRPKNAPKPNLFQRLVPNQPQPIANETLTNVNQAIPNANQVIPNANQVIPNANQAIPIANQAIPIANQAIPIANQAIPIANQAIPIANQAIPIDNRAIPNANQAVLVPNHQQRLQIANQRLFYQGSPIPYQGLRQNRPIPKQAQAVLPHPSRTRSLLTRTQSVLIEPIPNRIQRDQRPASGRGATIGFHGFHPKPGATMPRRNDDQHQISPYSSNDLVCPEMDRELPYVTVTPRVVLRPTRRFESMGATASGGVAPQQPQYSVNTDSQPNNPTVGLNNLNQQFGQLNIRVRTILENLETSRNLNVGNNSAMSNGAIPKRTNSLYDRKPL